MQRIICLYTFQHIQGIGTILQLGHLGGQVKCRTCAKQGGPHCCKDWGGETYSTKNMPSSKSSDLSDLTLKSS